MMNWTRRWVGWWFAAMAAWVASAGLAVAADPAYRVQLVWGTDEARPEGKELRPLDPAMAARLRQLRFKNYFVTKTEPASADAREYRRVTLSDRCAVDLKEVGGGKLEVRMLSLKAGSEPRQVASRTVGIEQLRKGEMMIYAGDSKDRWEDCWLVIVDAPASAPASAPAKSPDGKP